MRRSIPFFIESGRTQSEIGRKIDDPWGNSPVVLNLPGSHTMWQTKEKYVTWCQVIRMTEA